MGALLRRSLASLGAVFALVLAGLAAPPASAFVFHVSVTRAVKDRAVAEGFLGLALEYNMIPEWVDDSKPVDPVLVQLIRNLDPTGRPVIRIGGQSTDRSWWPVPGMKRPLGITYDLNDAWAAAAHRFGQALDAKLLLGVNLEANSTRISSAEANHLVAGVGRQYIGNLAIGNEPALYTGVPWYKMLNGHPVPWYSHTGTAIYSRPKSTWSPAAFAGEIARTKAVMPRVPLSGPEGGQPWIAAFDRFLSPHSQVRMLTSHAYGLNQCVHTPSDPEYPSVPHLLAPIASRGLVSAIGPYIRLAHRDGATYRIDEMGSVSCNGHPGVSNTFAAALWVMDALFSIADHNIDGVNLHTYPNSVNALFDLVNGHRGWQATVRPLYYGAMMFAQAAPGGSRLLRLHSDSQSQLRVWSTLGRDHRVRVLLINDSLRSRALAVVHAPRGFGSATGTVERLTASSAYATGGVSIGGRRFATTRSGRLRAPVTTSARSHGGSYSVTVPASSAALLTLS